MARATIMDVAKMVGVSKSTVSKALNLPAEQCPVAEATRLRILEAAKELGYHASWNARSLNNSTGTQQIGFIFERSHPETRGIYFEMLKAISDKITHDNFFMLYLGMSLGPLDDVLASRRVDGCIINSSEPSLARLLKKTRMPAVYINQRSQEGFTAIVPDDFNGAVLATKKLISLGHRRIMYARYEVPSNEVGGNDHFSIPERVAGFKHAMLEAGLGSEMVICDGKDNHRLEQTKYGPGGVTAVITYRDCDGMKMLSALQRKGLVIPRDVSLIAFNNVFPFEELCPTISAVDIPAGHMGKLAVELLLGELAGQSEPRGNVVVPEELVLRESVGPAPS